MENDIKDIQNSLWRIYKIFLSDHDVRRYTQNAAAIVQKYQENKEMQSFCINLLISWTPVINNLAKEFKKGD